MNDGEHRQLVVLNRGTHEGADCEACPFSRFGQPNRPVYSEYPDDPAFLIVGEGPGHNEVFQKRPFCLTPDTSVLMADLSWRPIGQIVVGDQILSIDEESQPGSGASGRAARRWHVATITATRSRVAEAFEVDTERGILRGSADHPVLVRWGRKTNANSGSGKTVWREIGDLRVEGGPGHPSRIVFVGEPWEQRYDYPAAWLAGFLDGEGHVLGSRPDISIARGNTSKKNGRVGFSQNAGPTYDRAVKAIREIGYEINAKEESRAKGVVCNRATISGGLATAMRFLGEVRPERLIENFKVAIENKHVRDLDTATVRSKKSIGQYELIDITTTTGTFIANGFVVHNCGASGEVVNKILRKIGRPRQDVYIGNATLCIPPSGSPEQERERAAACCRPRLMAELASFPGKPLLTLGAVAARTIIPKETLDAIDPPDTPKAIKKAQKQRQQPTIKMALARRKAINKIRDRRLNKMIEHHRRMLIAEMKAKFRKRPDEKWLQQEVNRVHGKLVVKAQQDAIKEFELKKKEREAKALAKAANPQKKKKAKRIKITDIVGTLFDVDCDGSGVRPIIPGIHPAALLRGGGASIGGSHTPDLAFVNLVYDASKINSLAQGKDVRLKLDVEYELTDQAKAIALFLETYRDALAEDACSLDLETYVDDPDRHSALMAYVAKIRVIGLATSKRSISLAWDLLPGWIHSLLQVLIGNVEMTYHNGLYDRTVLMAYGFVMGPRWFDTLLAHHCAFPGVSHRLQTVTAQFYGVTPWKSEFRNAEEDPVSLAVYNAKDTGSTHALRRPLAVWVKRTSTERPYAMDLKMSAAASHMHLAGMPVDREINSDLLATFSKQVKESRAAVEDVAADKKLREQIWHYLALQQARKQRKIDPDDFEARYELRLQSIKHDPDWKWKIGSGKHIAALLQALSVPLTQTTEGGDISTKKDVLETLTDVPIVRDILNYREADKLYSTFVWGMFDRHDQNGNIISYGFADENDRIHPIWNVHRISARWASQSPVVSNVPKDKWRKLAEVAAKIILGSQAGETAAKLLAAAAAKEAFKFLYHDITYRQNKDATLSQMTRPNLRRQIKARKGRKLVGFDFAQIEARVIALISGDPYLCRIFAENLDPHIENSRIIWPQFDSLDSDSRKQLREQSKPIGYGAMYLAQVETLHKQMLKEGHNIKLVDLAKAYNKLMTAMAGLVKWQAATVAQASQPPYEIKDFVLGRRRTWPMGQVEGTEAVNFGVQTAAASIMNTGMARIMEVIHEWREAYAIAQIHDACVFEVWEDDAVAFSLVVKECFEQEYERDGRVIRFTIDLKIGDDWSQV